MKHYPRHLLPKLTACIFALLTAVPALSAPDAAKPERGDEQVRERVRRAYNKALGLTMDGKTGEAALIVRKQLLSRDLTSEERRALLKLSFELERKLARDRCEVVPLYTDRHGKEHVVLRCLIVPRDQDAEKGSASK